MAQEETEGRKQFFVTQTSAKTQMSEQVQSNKQNNNVVIQNAKK
jgi:hypothetical protein